MGTGYYLGWHITISEFVTAWKRAMGMVKGTRAMALLLWRVELTGGLVVLLSSFSSSTWDFARQKRCQQQNGLTLLCGKRRMPGGELFEDFLVAFGSWLQKETETGNCQEFCLNSAWTCHRIRSFWKTHWSVLFKTSFAMPSSRRETHQNLGHMHFPL